MNDQTNDKLPSTEELCEKIEQLMKADYLSGEEKEELASKIIEIVQGRSIKGEVAQ